MTDFPVNIPFQLFSSCILVRGIKRSCIYDLQRGDFEYIPNSLYDVLIDSNNLTFEELLNLYQNEEDKDNLVQYFNFLYEKEFIFFSKLDKSFFPDYELKFHRPYNISTLVIDIDGLDLNYIERIKQNIYNSKAECLTIRIINSTHEDIINLLSQFNDISTRIIQLIIGKNIRYQDLIIEEIFKTNNRISLIIKSNEDGIENVETFERGIFINTSNDIINKQDEIVDISDFVPNLDLYIESKLHNTFYNRRVYCNSVGDIFRHEYDEKCFGNITNVEIEQILNNEEFKEYWNIKKDEIANCQNCEYRYMCVDNRLPIKKDGMWGFDKDCNYDPYTATWKKNDVLLEKI